MRWFLKGGTGGLLWLAFSTAVFGDTLFLTPGFNIDQGGQFTGYVSSNPSQQLSVYCVDYLNEFVSPVNVNVSTPLSMADIANTRYGTTTTSTPSVFNPIVGPSALDRYVMAAWLTQQYDFSTTSTDRDYSIQNAIWQLLDVQGITFTDGGSVPQWIANAEAWEAAQSLEALAAFESRVRIYTPVYVSGNTDLNLSDPCNRYSCAPPDLGPDGDSQEMIGVLDEGGTPQTLQAVPEPRTVVIIAAGLLAIGMFHMRIKTSTNRNVTL